MYTLTLAQAGGPVVIGLAAGLAASAFAARAIRQFLYEVDVVDPLVMALVAGILAVAAGAIAFLLARRAASVDPVEALRAE